MAFAGRIPLLGQLGDLGKVLVGSDVLYSGNEYVFTYEHGRLFEYRSDAWVRENMSKRVGNFGEVVSVTRPFFSDRYIINIISRTNKRLSEWLNMFEVIWEDMGYGKAKLVQVEEGKISTKPGGLPGVAVEIARPAGEAVSAAVMPVLSPILPYVAILGIAAIGFLVFMRKK